MLDVSENNIISNRTKNVSAQYSMLSTYFSQDTDSIDSSKNEFDSLADKIAGIFSSRIQVIDQNFTVVSDTYMMNKGKMCISSDVNKCFNGNNYSYTDKKNKSIVTLQSIKDNDGNITHVMFAVSSVSDIYSALNSIRIVSIAIIIIFGIIIIFVAIYFAYRNSRPFKEVSEAIVSVGAGDTIKEIHIKGCTEVNTISDSFNNMVQRLNRLETSRKEFVSNVSHELKTPITSMHVLAESLVGQQGVPEELYQEYLTDILGELDRENNIITDLLDLVKLDQNNIKMNVSSVNINELIESSLRLLRPVAKEKNIELVFESFNQIIAEIDETKLSMAITNLVLNGIKYNNVDGWVHVSLNSDQTYFYIKIQDNGYGIPEEAIEHIFDRFYRVDKARDRETGGTGLGLAITKSVVNVHRGTIKVYSEVDKGTTFSIQIPLTYVDK